MTSYKKKEKAAAIRLRKKGLSYKEILEQVPVAKSTLSLWLRDIPLDQTQKDRLDEKRLRVSRKTLATHATDESRRRGGVTCQKLHGHRLHRLTEEDSRKAGITYRKDELPIKAKRSLFRSKVL